MSADNENKPESPEGHPVDEQVAPVKRRWDDRVYDFFAPKWEKMKPVVLAFMIVLIFLLGLLFNRVFISIDSGDRGVLWRRFSGGTDMNMIFNEGFHLLNPFNKMYIYETRVQQRDTEFTVLSKDGLAIKVHAAIRFRPKITKLPQLHKEVGPGYVERVVIPQTQSVIRTILGNYDPHEILQSQNGILSNLKIDALAELGDRYIILDELLIRQLELPHIVKTAIENKLEQEQLYLAYEYRLQAEEQEVKRKIIEAYGINEFQSIINQGITPNYLKFKGIQATLELAKSNNSKILVVGNNENGLPIIFNADPVVAAPEMAIPATTPAKETPAPSQTSLKDRLNAVSTQMKGILKKTGIADPQKTK